MSAEPSNIRWIKTGEPMADDDPRLAGVLLVSDGPDDDPPPPEPMAPAEAEMRKEFATICRAICDQYETGVIDVVLLGFVDQAGRPVPIMAPMPYYAITDSLALADLMHASTRTVVDHRLRNPEG